MRLTAFSLLLRADLEAKQSDDIIAQFFADLPALGFDFGFVSANWSIWINFAFAKSWCQVVAIYPQLDHPQSFKM